MPVPEIRPQHVNVHEGIRRDAHAPVTGRRRPPPPPPDPTENQEMGSVDMIVLRQRLSGAIGASRQLMRYDDVDRGDLLAMQRGTAQDIKHQLDENIGENNRILSAHRAAEIQEGSGRLMHFNSVLDSQASRPDAISRVVEELHTSYARDKETIASGAVPRSLRGRWLPPPSRCPEEFAYAIIRPIIVDEPHGEIGAHVDVDMDQVNIQLDHVRTGVDTLRAGLNELRADREQADARLDRVLADTDQLHGAGADLRAEVAQFRTEVAQVRAQQMARAQMRPLVSGQSRPVPPEAEAIREARSPAPGVQPLDAAAHVASLEHNPEGGQNPPL